jgi:hypothetical protein
MFCCFRTNPVLKLELDLDPDSSIIKHKYLETTLFLQFCDFLCLFDLKNYVNVPLK